MKYTLEITNERNYDVIVVGSGPAGMAAAIMAGRNGMKTLLIESGGRVGGIATSGMMSHFAGTVGNKLYHEVLERAAEKNYFAPGVKTPEIDPEFLTITYIEMLEEAKVDTLLYTTFCDVVMEGKKIKGIICHSKDGFSAFYSNVVIDASGDGDVAYKCGAEFIKGREEDGKMQPATLMFKVGGVDMERAVFPESFETLVPTEKGELQALAKEKLPHPAGHVLLYKSPIPGIVTCNMTNVTDSVVVVGDNSTRTDLTINNTTYKVYNPQSDSYVPVLGEKYDDEVNRWYTYDEDGVRYYNTRINTN